MIGNMQRKRYIILVLLLISSSYFVYATPDCDCETGGPPCGPGDFCDSQSMEGCQAIGPLNGICVNCLLASLAKPGLREAGSSRFIDHRSTPSIPL